MAVKFASHRENSRINWGRDTEDGKNADPAAIKLGCLLRIADAVELIAKNYQSLINERDMYKRWYDEEKQRRQLLERRRSALRGVVTKLKKAG